MAKIEAKFEIGDRVLTKEPYYDVEAGLICGYNIGELDGSIAERYRVRFADGGEEWVMVSRLEKEPNALEHYTALLKESQAEKEAYELNNILKGFEMERE